MLDWQVKANREALKKLQEAGYEFEISANGYSVRHKGEFLIGAGVKLPRQKPLHWRHAEANRRDNLNIAVSMARTHQSKFSQTTT